MEIPNAPILDRFPYLTSDLPGVGGAIKLHEDDFCVEELPRYEPSGAGTHVFFMIEKRGLTTLDAVQRLARTLNRPARDIGMAGMKDARGVTRQVLSIEHVDPERVAALALPQVRVLWAKRHGNKLRTGHLAGNRFTIRVRDAAADAAQPAAAVLDVLRVRGVPNYFGPQRFGARGVNAAIGAAILRGDYAEAIAWVLGRPQPHEHGRLRQARELFDAGDLPACTQAWSRGFANETRLARAVLRSGPTAAAWRCLDQKLRSLFVSAVQSALFNRVLAERITGIDRLETGDLAYLHRNGACFRVEDAAVEQPRCASFEISPTGPIFGARMTAAGGAPGEREAGVLARFGAAPTQKRTPDGVRVDGARRPLRVPLADLAVEEAADAHGPFLQLAFVLPPGAYATDVLREVCKTNDPALEPPCA